MESSFSPFRKKIFFSFTSRTQWNHYAQYKVKTLTRETLSRSYYLEIIIIYGDLSLNQHHRGPVLGYEENRERKSEIEKEMEREILKEIEKRHSVKRDLVPKN